VILFAKDVGLLRGEEIPVRPSNHVAGMKAHDLAENISWDEFFRVFDASRDTFLHHDTNATRH